MRTGQKEETTEDKIEEKAEEEMTDKGIPEVEKEEEVEIDWNIS